ncbi:hypothetical protein [Viridibacillus arvi]|uniref:hypothetical protein n=1 Tax=Viridibacillus arvi TaxID=263475 RepID=UPI0034CF315C
MESGIVVPVDLTEEEKTVLAIFSIRQFLLVIPAGVFSLVQLIILNIPFISGFVDFGLRFVFFIIINLTTIALAFVPLERRNQYLSEFLITKIVFLKSQKVYTN